jgi:hypothetical protein
MPSGRKTFPSRVGRIVVLSEVVLLKEENYRKGQPMEAVSGVFSSRSDAERAMAEMRSIGLPADQITLLTPGQAETELQSVPADAAEQPGVGKAIGAVIGASAGLSGGALVMAAIPGVGLITAIGLLGSAVLGAAGASIGAAAGGKLEDSMTEGLPEDELFVYEDALRKGRSVVIALADESKAPLLRELLKAEGAEAVDAARDQWWIGLRDAEHEHYSTLGRNFTEDEKFYRLGFESALHARTRCKEYDQVMGEMNAEIEDLERQHPGVDIAEPFTRGYERGRDYYQQLCSESKAA